MAISVSTAGCCGWYIQFRLETSAGASGAYVLEPPARGWTLHNSSSGGFVSHTMCCPCFLQTVSGWTDAVRMATERECLDVFGYPPGSIPPFCLSMQHDNVLTLVDACLTEHDQLACGAGTATSFVVCDAETLVTVTGAQVVSVAKTSPSSVKPGVPSEDDSAPQFLADDTVGRLVKWLRLVSYGVLLVGWFTSCLVEQNVCQSKSLLFPVCCAPAWYRHRGRPPWLECGTLATSSRRTGAAVVDTTAENPAAQESKVALVRIGFCCGLSLLRFMADRREPTSPRSCLITTSGAIQSQLAELAERFPLISSRQQALRSTSSSHAPFSRCAKCNGPGFRELSRDEVVGRVPAYTQRTAPRFDECLRCGQVFWPGDIYARAKHTDKKK